MTGHHGRRRAGLAALAIGLLLPACGPVTAGDEPRGVTVLATSGVLADLAGQVARGRGRVVSLVPEGAEPGSHEPTLRETREVARADLALSNYPLFDGPGLTRSLAANLPDDAPHVVLAADALRYGADPIPLVEDPALDALWLGIRSSEENELGSSAVVHVSVTGVDGPGDVVGYLTGSFGQAEVFLDSRDGFSAADGYRDDTFTLPVAGHSHMSWAFTEAGVHRLRLAASVQRSPDARPVRVATGSLVLAVAVDPREAGVAGAEVVDRGHADLTVDLADRSLRLTADGEPGRHDHAHAGEGRGGDLGTTVVAVPARTLTSLTDAPAHRALGREGEEVFQLPQAVLGRSVHGEIDPHLWYDPSNARAYVQAIRDALVRVDPAGATTYVANADRALTELDELDTHLRSLLDGVPAARRRLVTTHPGFSYLARRYDLELAGYLVTSPGVDPGPQERSRLLATVRGLRIPAVFTDHTPSAASRVLEQVAEDAGLRACRLPGSALDAGMPTYHDLMLAAVRTIRGCLDRPTE